MKKTASIVLSIALMLLCFYGCTSEIGDAQIKEKVDAAFKKNEELKSSSVYSENTLVFGEDAYSTTTITTTTHIMETGIGDEEKYEMSGETEILLGGVSSSSYESYYKNGYYYTDRYKGLFKTKTDVSELSSADSSDAEISFDDMKTVEILENTGYELSLPKDEEGSATTIEGCTVVSFECKNRFIRSYIEKALSDNGSETSEIEVKSGSGKYVINKDGYIIEHQLDMGATVNEDGVENVAQVKTVICYADVGEEINPYDPEDADYTEVDNLDDIVALNSAMSNSLTTANMDIEFESTADIEQGDSTAGYERTYHRQFNRDNKKFFQEVNTTYFTKGKKGSDVLSGSYYTDGMYYNMSEKYNHKVKSEMDFSSFVSTIYSSVSVIPADVYSPAMMKTVKVKEKGDETIYEFTLNEESDGGLEFLNNLFAPYEGQFGGDVSSAKITVNSFEGKSYVDKNGRYYKTEMKCDIDFGFEEGDVSVKSEQTVLVNDSKDSENIEFPEFKGYSKMDSAELLSGY